MTFKGLSLHDSRFSSQGLLLLPPAHYHQTKQIMGEFWRLMLVLPKQHRPDPRLVSKCIVRMESLVCCAREDLSLYMRLPVFLFFVLFLVLALSANERFKRSYLPLPSQRPTSAPTVARQSYPSLGKVLHDFGSLYCFSSGASFGCSICSCPGC